LYPVWFGRVSSVWTKNKDRKAFLLDEILKVYGHDNLKNNWTRTRFRTEYDWDVSDKNFLDFQNVLKSI
jgi:hypothetical protein